MSSLNVKQIVDKPTRGAAILDLIITNLHQLYQSPHIRAPLGSSDQYIVYWHPSNDRVNEEKHQVKSTKQLVRRYPRSGMVNMKSNMGKMTYCKSEVKHLRKSNARRW